ncbi:hypothetical protein GH714_028538 [Hevea brasiliensis]|uniref:Uncharacterized protein n=1 Tax=Hevea brasiliensis TaxID=3981 RepID=A0A6A6MEU7_HEVBR|nr:hypothetical protein GH714_028538 [Hevea brasiliensis]
MPTSPRENSSEINEKVPSDNGGTSFSNGISVFSTMILSNNHEVRVNITNSDNHQKLEDKSYDSFKTWSGKLERQISHLRGKPRKPSPENSVEHVDALPVDRYYDALEGPEMENLRASEEIVLPDDKLWPFLLRYPITSFDLRTVDVWRTKKAFKSGESFKSSLNFRELCWGIVGCINGAKEGPIFFFAVGLAHYTVLFVTLYQRLPTNETLQKELHPVFFLFVAAPSVASMAWAKIQGSFDYGSRIAYFIALFLYFSLAVRINFFRGFKFSLAWWAYTFPMTGAAIATIRYSNEVTNILTRTLAVILSITSTFIVTALLVTTIVHAFVLRDLFPNDIAIAISEKRPKHHHHRHKKWSHRRRGSSENKEIENYGWYETSDWEDIEASTNPPSSLLDRGK